MSAKILPFRRVEGDLPEMSDDALLAACGTGDSAALGALFDRFNADVYRLAGRFPRIDELERDDIVQATFMQVTRMAPTYRGIASVRTWILGIAANVARRQFRSEQRRRSRQAKYLALPSSAPRGVDEQFDRRQLVARIEVALSDLSHDQQVAFVLCDLEQLPGRDVARVLDVPEGTLARRLHDARKAMRAALERGQK
ncbi:MAG TPA: RNA polymerase sigma factor [Kofleriaceae bacterium]|jgi:RNA polymerase sigma-70 factor (ECF subfamily)